MAGDDDLPEGVKRLPIRFKSPVSPDRSLVWPHEVGQHTTCFHRKFIVDDAKSEVECAECHEKLNPMWVLKTLCGRDHRFHEAHTRYNDEMKRLAERSYTKCDYCQKMTRISRR
jgi:hypothetical protein